MFFNEGSIYQEPPVNDLRLYDSKLPVYVFWWFQLQLITGLYILKLEYISIFVNNSKEKVFYLLKATS